MTNLKGLRIVSLQAENIKRLYAIEIKPTSDMVVVSGKNGNGKSSVLDAIWWCLAGATHIQSVPIRRGANEARIRLDLGEIIVTRRFKKGVDGETTGIMVETPKGARLTSPQKILDGLLGSLCMDPLKFAALGETPEGKRQQLRELQKFVPGYNFDEQDGLNKADMERRADVNKLILQTKAAADLISVPEDTPDEETDEGALVAALEAAGKVNQLNERRRQNRAAAELSLRQLRARHQQITPELQGIVAEIQAHCDENVRMLEEQIKRAREQAAAKIIETTGAADREHALVSVQIESLVRQFAAAEEIPEDTDTEVIRANITVAREGNIHVRKKLERAEHTAMHARHTAEAQALTDRMLARQAAKRAAIAAAKMPVPGLDLGVSEILLNGLPFDQASDAERLRTSMAIAIAQKPDLRVIRIREGSTLDSDGMKIVEEMAAANDMQVWIERVTDGESVGFVIEDGRVRQ